MKRGLQAATSEAQSIDRFSDLQGQPENLLSVEAARFCGFDRKHTGEARTIRETMRLFREFAQRKRIPVLHRGRTLLYERRVLLAFLKGDTWTRNRHGETVTGSRSGRKTKTVTGNTVASSELA